MINSVKSDYISSLMAKQPVKRQMLPDSQPKIPNHSKSSSNSPEDIHKELQNEKLMIENSLLLMKSSAGEGGDSKEALKKLEEQLQEITKSIEVSKSDMPAVSSKDDKSVSRERHHFDRVEISQEGRDNLRSSLESLQKQSAEALKNQDPAEQVEKNPYLVASSIK